LPEALGDCRNEIAHPLRVRVHARLEDVENELILTRSRMKTALEKQVETVVFRLVHDFSPVEEPL
jgi:hypothetical protein